MSTQVQRSHMYDGDADELIRSAGQAQRIVVVPTGIDPKQPAESPSIRILWGQHLLEDLLAGRYKTLVCAVNADDNSHGMIAQLAELLPTSQWDEPSITDRAKQFSQAGDKVKVLKYDMDAVEVLGLLRPPGSEHLTLEDISLGFKIVNEMIRRRTSRLPSASVSFLGGRSNRLLNEQGEEPSLETVLRTMHEAGYAGDIYPPLTMWEMAPTAVYARYPFPESVQQVREGGF